MINPPFHVAVFKHSSTTKCFEGALHSQNTHKYFASVTTKLRRCAAAQMLVKNYIYKYLYIYIYIFLLLRDNFDFVAPRDKTDIEVLE